MAHNRKLSLVSIPQSELFSYQPLLRKDGREVDLRGDGGEGDRRQDAPLPPSHPEERAANCEVCTQVEAERFLGFSWGGEVILRWRVR